MPWFQVRFTSPQDTAEAYSDLLMELGAVSVTYEDGADQPLLEPAPGETPLWDRIDVVGLFDAELPQQWVAQQLREQLPQSITSSVTITELEERDWVRAWMDDFHPMHFGQRLWIIPSWSEPVDPNDINILLDPGLAFGSGTHPTTALCLEWLDSHPPEQNTVIDYGCGSGILAIAAARLGASHIYAIDNDPQALIATRDNATKNGVEQIKPLLPEEFDGQKETELLLANILSGPLEQLAPRFAALVSRSGTIVLSGILSEQSEGLIQIYSQWFRMEPPEYREEWCRLVGQRNGAP